MEAEEEMIEEHLEESEASSTLTNETEELVPVPALTSLTDKKKLQARRKLVALFAVHMQNFQQAIITNRRRCQQRQRRRQSMLRAFYVQQLLELETNFIELIPLPGMSELREQDKNKPTIEENQSNADGDVAQTKPRIGFYEHVETEFTEQQWLQTFRMSRRSFQWLCGQLRTALQPHAINAPLKNLISLEKRVALSLYAFATGTDYRTIAQLFDISRTSVCKFMKRFADAVLVKLGPTLLAMPKSAQEYKEIRNNFQKASNMPPLAVGVLGLCELPVCPVSDDVSAYTNDAGLTSIILQTIVDDRCLFRKVQVNSQRPQLMLDMPNEVTNLGLLKVNRRMLYSFIVTSSPFYPLRPWLMHRYNEPVEPHEYDFNEAVDNLLVFKEHAFRRLFARWKILQRKVDLEPQTMEAIAVACCALHNLLEESDEGYMEEWAEGLQMSCLNESNYQHNGNVWPDAEAALNVRDFLARTISSTEM